MPLNVGRYAQGSNFESATENGPIPDGFHAKWPLALRPFQSFSVSAFQYFSISVFQYFSSYFLAERVGFEPTGPCGPSVFKTAAIDHSATSPCGERRFKASRHIGGPSSSAPARCYPSISLPLAASTIASFSRWAVGSARKTRRPVWRRSRSMTSRSSSVRRRLSTSGWTITTRSPSRPR